MQSTITITYGDQAENHVGMQKIGEMADDGFTIKELKEAKKEFEKKGCKCELVDLNKYLPVKSKKKAEKAAVLIVRNGVDYVLGDIGKNADDMFQEQSDLQVDKKAYMYGRVVNKRARHNLCFADHSQEPDYENGKGRIIAFDQVPLTDYIRTNLNAFLGEKANDLTAEGNYYYDVRKCGIGFHGDAERKRVIAVRLGASLPLHYQWFHNSGPIGKRAKLVIEHGDIYVMSEKATGFDWKKKSQITLRHAAGAKKYLTIKAKN